MTLNETRQLGIEFERRIQTMIPEREFLEKLDTETIYSFLNQYQDKYIHDIYRNLDNVPSGSKLSAHTESILQSLIETWECKKTIGENQGVNTDSIVDNNGVAIIDTARSITFNLPQNFYMYIRSVSNVSSTYAYKDNRNNNSTSIIPNQLVSQNDVWKLVETPHNSLRILRYPAIVLGANNTASVIYDQYTDVNGIKLLYYKQPAHFSILTSIPCELPMDAFDDIVTGAVDLYVQYAAGAEARKKQLLKEQQQRNKQSRSKKDEDDEE